MPHTERNILWTPWSAPGLEHLRLVQQVSVIADGLVIGIKEQLPFRLHYIVRCDQSWHVREVKLQLLGDELKDRILYADGVGRWHGAAGAALSSLDGCLDVDIAVTPFTNTLPIRRLDLSVGSSAVIDVAYVTAPDLQVKRDQQQYTCVEQNDNGWLYRYESLDSGFVAMIPVDEAGLVLDYPELFRRIWAD